MQIANWKRILIGIALSASSAILFTLAFPPHDCWLLIFLGLIPMIIAQHRVMPEKLSGLAYGIGVGGFFAGYFQGVFSDSVWYMRALPLFIALFSALITWRDRSFHRQTQYRWLWLHGPTMWVGIEFFRGIVPVIGTWGFAAYALYEQSWLIQPISIFGIYGQSFLILMVNYALGLAALKLFDHYVRFGSDEYKVCWSPVRKGLFFTALFSLIWAGTSYFMYKTANNADSHTVRVAAIHPAFKVQSVEDVQMLMEQTRQAASEGAELIVWNEGALQFDPQQSHTDVLKALTAETNTYLIIGYAFDTDRGHRNEAVILTPQGEFFGPYGKTHPVAWSGETSVSSGPYQAYSTALGRLGMIICYDLDFTDSARHVARSGAQLVAVPSFDWRHIASKHYTHLVFRAVENRVVMVKADVGFDSAIIDSRGRIVSSTVTPKPQADILVADVPLGSGNTPLVRIGDWFGWLALAGALAFFGLDLITTCSWVGMER